MPAPVTPLPTWASDANYPAGAAGWNATATKVQPTAGQIAEGWEPSQRPPAQYVNWLLNLICQWILYLVGYNTATKTLVISGCTMLPFGAGTVSYTYNDGVSNVTDVLDVVAGLSLPLGATITAVRARVKDNAAGPTTLELFMTDADGAGGVTPTATAVSAGDGTSQTLSVPALTTVVTAGHAYAIVVGTTAGMATCNCYSVEVDYTLPQ